MISGVHIHVELTQSGYGLLSRDCAYCVTFLMTVNLQDVFAFCALLNCSTGGSIKYHKLIEIL